MKNYNTFYKIGIMPKNRIEKIFENINIGTYFGTEKSFQRATK